MDRTPIPATFVSEEIAAITRGQVPRDTQHDWNRRGLLSDGVGGKRPIRRSLLETAIILSMGALNALNIGPTAGLVLARSMAVQILLHAQREDGAVFDHTGFFQEAPVTASPGALKRYAVTVDGSTWQWTDSVDAALQRLGVAQAVSIDLQALARQLVANAGKPLWTVVEQP